MVLLIFHLFLSGFTNDGVDILMAQKIVDWNLKRYPEGNLCLFHRRLNIYALDLGVFFLLAQGRLSSCRGQPARAIASYQKAMSVQAQYRNLHHVSFWEMAVSNLELWEIEESLKCWRNLHEEATVYLLLPYKHGISA
jgi:tetratricopeptide (TPR) repeat protein